MASDRLLNSIKELDEPLSSQWSPCKQAESSPIDQILDEALKTPFSVRIDQTLLAAHRQDLLERLHQAIEDLVNKKVEAQL